MGGSGASPLKCEETSWFKASNIGRLTHLYENRGGGGGKLAKIAFGVRKNEKLQTRIKDKGLDVYLQVRKDETGTGRHVMFEIICTD